MLQDSIVMLKDTKKEEKISKNTSIRDSIVVLEERRASNELDAKQVAHLKKENDAK